MFKNARRMIQNDGMFFKERRRLTRKIPTSVFTSIMVDDGGLVAYAANLQAMIRRSAVYIVKIFNGAKLDRLPVELPTRFEFAINLRTAKAIGLTISPTILNRADKVIE